jgi:Fe-S-cluster-containing dehydrogenase component
MAKRIVLDLDYCIGCQSCAAACQAAFHGEARIRYGDLSASVFLPMACRHCEEPLCAAACPFEVLYKQQTADGRRQTADGRGPSAVSREPYAVVQSNFRCIGCRSCILACPWGVIDEGLLRNISQKCSECIDREAMSGRSGPRCVSACASGALKFMDETELDKPEVARRFLSRSPFWRRT